LNRPESGDTRPEGPGAPKGHRAGTHRLISPEETLEAVGRFVPEMGITRVADITGLDVIGIPVATACRPNSRSVVVSLGKGLDLAAAKASAVMENIEAFMAERITRPLILGSFNDLRSSHPLVDVERLPRSTSTLYDPDLPILWIEGQELLTRTPVWVPYDMVHTAYTLPTPTGTGCFLATSNGLASGNHLLEAISHGICEVVERDSASLHSLRTPAELQSRRIDPATVDDDDCREALERLDRAGMAVQIWDMTTDIEIPAFVCVIAEAGESQRVLQPGYPAEGMGCHPDKAIAMLRALTEAAQARAGLISGVRDDPAQWARSQPLETPAPTLHSTDAAEEAKGDFSAVRAFASDSLDEDVAWELGRLRSVGISEVVAVDLTREEFGIPVVRMIVPGLEGPSGIVSTCRLGQRAMDLIGSQ
jgi:YcaO-like protein with predicted kinase domain